MRTTVIRDRSSARARAFLVRAIAGFVPTALVALGVASPVVAHGAGVPDEPTVATLFTAWSFDLSIWIPLGVAFLAHRLLVRRVDRAHPANPVPRGQRLAFVAALGAIVLALQSPIERYDTTLFSVHMVQHILLSFVAAPLLALSAPVTLLLRAATRPVRARWILPVLHSRVVRFLAHPLVAWAAFAGVMWGSHFSPLFDAALEDELVHDLEHLLFLGSALLFWWPAVGRDPVPWRMPHPVRVAYLFLQMPQNTFLSVAIYGAAAPLYVHYVTLGRTWGPTPLADQQAAGAIMWLLGDAAFLVAILGVVVAWLRADERDAGRREARIDEAREAIRERERLLAERRAREAGSGPGAAGSPETLGQPGSGAER